LSVRYRMVKTALEAQCRLPGGKRIASAIIDARKKLQALGPETLRLIDAGLLEIASLVDTPGQTRPADIDLIRINVLADELVGYCSTVTLPGLDTAFVRLSQLSYAVLHTTYWRNGTFAPTLVVLNMARHQTLPLEDLQKLFGGIDECTQKYMSQRSEPGDGPGIDGVDLTGIELGRAH